MPVCAYYCELATVRFEFDVIQNSHEGLAIYEEDLQLLSISLVGVAKVTGIGNQGQYRKSPVCHASADLVIAQRDAFRETSMDESFFQSSANNHFCKNSSFRWNTLKKVYFFFHIPAILCRLSHGSFQLVQDSTQRFKLVKGSSQRFIQFKFQSFKLVKDSILLQVKDSKFKFQRFNSIQVQDVKDSSQFKFKMSKIQASQRFKSKIQVNSSFKDSS
ncbi:hypothetical protein CEXT_68851 [Caerostris extrusa]|uniref:Cyclic nucleotide-binding domain-containing protein n=1 Tax=Caerostris extrusa TaxID=172846 RepID=A0AAV4TGV6_CAEEX|nr:hypothetical protein CEXT_68851 [Caerostris extrusa]